MDDKSSERGLRASPSEWVARYGDYLHRYALSRLRDEGPTDDVVQETFLAGFQHRDQYRGSGTEQSWLLAILRRKVVDFIRDKARENGQFAAIGVDCTTDCLFDECGRLDVDQIRFESDPSKISENRELWFLLTECLRELPQKQADVFVLRELEGMGSDEICETLNVSKSNLWVLLHRARLGLARCLSSHGQEKEDE